MTIEDSEDPRGWDEACRRESVIRELIARFPDRLTTSAVDAAAVDLGLSRPTVYRLLERYKAERTVSASVERTRGRKEGTRLLKPG
jgi:hypothetical protein